MAQTARRIVFDRHEIRNFKLAVSLIVHHQADPETALDPQTRNPFLCAACRHSKRLCDCRQKTEVQ